MMERLYGIRGAVGCKNTADAILTAVDRLCSRLFAANSLSADKIVSIQWTITPDLTAMNPATALRRSSAASVAAGCALFCAAEPVIAGGTPGMLRVLVTAYLPAGSRPVPVYIDGAEKLRPDLVSPESAG
ncbi:MAG: chorismate mutase [Spirochaetaceae bacterium]|jgi:chorismate mutase|nr:chorismate mutase [Spirochaetaceae bacterium]